jgi:sigma-E factor negative regulatory protein RseC
MIEQRARVIGVEGDLVRIRTEAQTGCHSCGAKSGCGSALIAQMFPARFNQQLLLPRGQLSTPPGPGDFVVIGIDEGYLQKSSLLLYAVPLLGLLAGAIVGQAALGTELAAIGGGLSGLGVGLLAIRWGAQRLLSRAPEAMRILRVERSQASVALNTLDISSL